MFANCEFMNQFLLLLALCVFDFLVIVTVILLKGIPTIDENHSLKLLLPVVHPLMNLTWIMSIYLTVLLAIERFMVICWTNLKTKHYTKKRTKVYLLFTFVFVVIYNIPKCMEYTWETHTIRTGKGSLISEFGPMCEEVLFNCTNVSFQFYVFSIVDRFHIMRVFFSLK